MKLSTINFAVFFSYFIFSALANSTFVVVEQALYEYAMDNQNAETVRTLSNVAYLFVAFLVAPFLRTFGYKKVLVVCSLFSGIAALLMPFGTNFIVPKIFYFSVGLGLATSRLIGYKVLYLLSADQKYFSGIINFFEGVFALGAMFGVAVFMALQNNEWLHWRNGFAFFGLLSLVNAFLIFRSKMTTIDSKLTKYRAKLNRKDFFSALQGTISMLRYTLVLLFLLILMLLTLTENQFITWLPLFCSQIVHLPTNMASQLLYPILFGVFLGRLVASILLRTISALPLLLFCLLSVMSLLFFITQIIQHQQITTNLTWETVPPVIWLLPLLSFFWAPLQPTLFVIVINNVETAKNTSKTTMLGLLMSFTLLSQLFMQSLTNYIFSVFSISVAFFTSIIFVMILFTIIILFVNDLKKTNAG
jgi:MFS transporter, FHS family, glucose/mannose:H+ symporter